MVGGVPSSAVILEMAGKVRIKHPCLFNAGCAGDKNIYHLSGVSNIAVDLREFKTRKSAGMFATN